MTTDNQIDYYSYTPNPIDLNRDKTFNLTYHAFEILRPVGIFYLMDLNHHILGEFNPITVLLRGSGICNPVDMVFDSSHNLFVLCDLSPYPNINSQTNFVIVSTTKGLLTIGQLSYGIPTNICIDTNQQLYVSFADGGLIAKYDSETGEERGGPWIPSVSSPSAIYVDLSFNLYVGCQTTVQKYDPTGQLDAVFQTNFVPLTHGTKIDSLCVIAPYLYISTTRNNRLSSVSQYSLTGEFLHIVFTTNNYHSRKLICGSNQFLYHVMSSSPPTSVLVFVRINTQDFSATLSEYNGMEPINMYSVAFNPATPNQLYATNQTIVNSIVLDFVSHLSTVVDVFYDASTEINYPQYLVFDDTGFLYVSNFMTGTICKINIADSSTIVLTRLAFPTSMVIHQSFLYVATWVGNNTLIYRGTITEPSTFALFSTIHNHVNPQGFCIDPSGNYLFLATCDKGYNVPQKYRASILRISLQDGANHVAVVQRRDGIIYGMLFDDASHLFVALNLSGSSMVPRPGFIYTYNSLNFDQAPVLYVEDYKDLSGNVQSLINPTGVALDSNNNLYIASLNPDNNGIVLQCDRISGDTTLFAQAANIMNNPIGLTLNISSGDLYVACQNNNTVLHISTHDIVFSNMSTEYFKNGANNLQILDPYNLVDITVYCVCFMKGTHLLTANRGYCRVELLTMDDVLETAGTLLFRKKQTPIVSIGRFKIKGRTNENTAPVCIKRGALYDNVPCRDLYISPEHKICINHRRLISARELINGTTIVQDFLLRDVEYYHIEMETHCLLVSDNVFAESYRKTGKFKFDQWTTRLYEPPPRPSLPMMFFPL